MYICKTIDNNIGMRDCLFFCLLMIWLLMSYNSLNAQQWQSVSDCQLMKHEMTATRPFQTMSWVQAACGNDYMLKELMRMRCDAVLLWNRHAFIFHLAHNGYSKYGELTSSIGYALRFGGKVAVGLQFHYLFQHVANSEAQNSVTFDVSLFAQVARKLSFGFEVYNPARLKYGIHGRDVIPMRFKVLVLCAYSEKLSFTVHVLKYLPGRFDVSAACCYRPLDYFYLSLACSLYNANCGIMFRCRSLYFTVDSRYNYRLGFAIEVGVLVQFQFIKP